MALSKSEARDRRKKRIRKKISGTSERPRLSVFRSLNHLYLQVIDDDRGVTIASASSQEKGFEAEGAKTAKATKVGALLAARLQEKGIKQVVFDRSGYMYHGRVKAAADGAREAGLEF